MRVGNLCCFKIKTGIYGTAVTSPLALGRPPPTYNRSLKAKIRRINRNFLKEIKLMSRNG